MAGVHNQDGDSYTMYKVTEINVQVHAAVAAIQKQSEKIQQHSANANHV